MRECTKLGDSLLIEKTVALIRQEREILSEILEHFREIERRRLFSELGYKSLFEMAVQKFGYSEAQAYRRINAMRLINDLPEVEAKIVSGELNLTHLSVAQNLFSQEKQSSAEMPKAQKLAVLQEIAGKTKRDTEKIVMSYSSNPIQLKADRVEAVTPEHIELKFTASAEVQDKIATLKGLLAHSNPNISLGELFEMLCDLGIQKHSLSPAKKRCVKEGSAQGQKQSPSRPHAIPKPQAQSAQRSQKFIAKVEIRRQVFARAQNKCEKCGSQHALQVDHIIPQAKGGSSHPQNLRLLCRSCNQRAAIKEFGQVKMDRYLNAPSNEE